MTKECSDCGTEFRPHSLRETLCLASCCANVAPNCLCPNCWAPHFAQFYLDAHGYTHGYFGEHHAEAVVMMANFKAQR